MLTCCRIFLAVCLLVTTLNSHGQAKLLGDPQAVSLVEQMLERLGGREIWARSRSLILEYHGWRKNPAQAVIERAWRDLQEPNQRMEIEARMVNVIRAFTPMTGWTSRNGIVAEMTMIDHAADLSYWPYDFYTIIHALAIAKPNIRLEFEAPMRVNVKTDNGSDWGWWEIDSTGAPTRWGAVYGQDEEVEYIYGPVKSFGNINFPAWGTAVDASWRFDYVKVDVSIDPIPEALLQRP